MDSIKESWSDNAVGFVVGITVGLFDGWVVGDGIASDDGLSVVVVVGSPGKAFLRSYEF